MKKIRVFLFVLPVLFCSLNAKAAQNPDLSYGFADNSIVLKPRLTLFYYGNIKDDILFSGKADIKINLKGTKIGLANWSLNTQFEQNFGESVNQTEGVLFPVNSALYCPGTGDASFDISSLYLYYSASSFSVSVGKINMIEMASGSRFQGGAGIDGPMHIAFVATPSLIIPPYILGAVAGLKTEKLNYSFMLFRPEGAVNKSGFEESWTGITAAVSAELPVKIKEKPGSHGIKIAYSTEGGVDLDEINTPVRYADADIKSGKYYVNYFFSQYIMTYNDKGEGWGIYGHFAVTDGNPNLLKASAVLGLGGNSFIANRSKDRWGIGYFYFALSDGLKKYASSRIPLRDEQGSEIYYSLFITNRLSLTCNIQCVFPGVRSASPDDNIFYGGLRVRFLP